MDRSQGRCEKRADFDMPLVHVQAIEDVPLQATGEHKNMHPPQQFLEQKKLVSVEGLFYVIKDNEKELRDCFAAILFPLKSLCMS